MRSRTRSFCVLESVALCAILSVTGCGANASDDASGTVTEGVAVGIGGPIAHPPIGFPTPVFTPMPAGCDAPRDITDWGNGALYRAYADVNGDHKLDWCRFVGTAPNVFLSCQLACPNDLYGISNGYNSIVGVDPGIAIDKESTIRDLNDDGFGDFCRNVGAAPNTHVACMMGTRTGFDPNPFGVTLPPNTPSIDVHVAPLPAGLLLQGQPLTFAITITNHLPWVQAGYAVADLTQTTTLQKLTTVSPGSSYNIQPSQSITSTLTLAAPVPGTYAAFGFFEQSVPPQILYTATSSPQPIVVSPPVTPPTARLYPTGTQDTSSGQTIAITAGDSFDASYEVTPSPYCHSSHYTLRYNPNGQANVTLRAGTATEQTLSNVVYAPAASGNATLDVTCDSDAALSAHAVVNIRVEAPAPPPPPPSHDATASIYLPRNAPANGGNLYYGGSLPAASIYGTAHSLQNPVNNPAIAIVQIGATSDDCFDASKAVTLKPGATTSAADMQKLYGSSSPALPLPVVACVYASGSPPVTLPVTIAYTYQ